MCFLSFSKVLNYPQNTKEAANNHFRNNGKLLFNSDEFKTLIFRCCTPHNDRVECRKNEPILLT